MAAPARTGEPEPDRSGSGAPLRAGADQGHGPLLGPPACREGQSAHLSPTATPQGHLCPLNPIINGEGLHFLYLWGFNSIFYYILLHFTKVLVCHGLEKQNKTKP